MVEDRRLAVLRAIVEDYVSTREPVGSKALVERHNLGVSPATVRNDMAALEDEGYIAQPHTSAGRVPTDRGYRLFVDRLSAVRALSPAERQAISRFLNEAVDLDDVVTRSVRLLAQITRQVALVQYPTLDRSTVRHLELVSLTDSRLMLILVADSGRLEQRTIDCHRVVDPTVVADLRGKLAAAVMGRRFAEVPALVAGIVDEMPIEERGLAQAVIASLLESVVERSDDRIVIGGAANLARYGDDFPLQIQPVLEALEEQVVLMRLLGEVSEQQHVTVLIGHENTVERLGSTSVVTTGYGPGDDVVGRLGIVGPTHMDYPGSIAAVQAVAGYLSKILQQQ